MAWSDIPGRFAYGWIHTDFVAAAPHGSLVVEVGVALGKSLAHLAAACIGAGRKDINVVGVDAWGGYARNGEQVEMNAAKDGTTAAAEGDYQLFLHMMNKHAHQEKCFVNWFRQTSALGAAVFRNRSLDLVCLDADHTYEAVKSDLRAWIPKLKDGGTIGGDDWMPEHPGVEQAVREVFREVEVRVIDGWGTWRASVGGQR